MLGDRRRERREERRGGGGRTHYRMRQKLVSIGDDYWIEDDGRSVAEVSKKWFRVADTYGVEVAPGQDPVLLLAITAVLDTMAHEAR